MHLGDYILNEIKLLQIMISNVKAPPKDGSLLLMLVKGDNFDYPTEDSDTFWTIGYNSLEDTGEDTWYMVGWDWSFDEFCHVEYSKKKQKGTSKAASTLDILAWVKVPSTSITDINNTLTEV